jgi:S-methylmethionine-dependent homocysteine/selenocysteine methylase
MTTGLRNREEFDAVWSRSPLLLDGANGTELERCGCAGPPPLWASQALLEAPEQVAALHRAYLAAGSDVLVANTFRTNPRALLRAGVPDQGLRLNSLAVELARQACDSVSRQVLVASSIAPVEDCYHPEWVPDEATLKRELNQMMEWQLAAEPDLVMIETANNLSEARLAAAAAAERGLRMVVSFVLQEDGRLLDGAPLDEAVDAVSRHDPLALGVNCVPPRGVAPLIERFRAITSQRLVAYAHIANSDPITGWTYAQESVSPDEYLEEVRRWRLAGVDIIGGCCGTTPDHIRAIAEDWGRELA